MFIFVTNAPADSLDDPCLVELLAPGKRRLFGVPRRGVRVMMVADGPDATLLAGRVAGRLRRAGALFEVWGVSEGFRAKFLVERESGRRRPKLADGRDC